MMKNDSSPSPQPSPRVGRRKTPVSRRATRGEGVSRAIGVISGTSMDGIDVALIESGGEAQLEAGPAATFPYPKDVAHPFRALGAACRSAPVKAGGEGAPPAPIYPAAMAAGLERPLMILNWGGVGNVTYLGLKGEIIAFDTGPANALIDDFLTSRRGLAFDNNGMIAASGRLDPAALAMLMGDPYFDRPAPKSLDRNHFSALAACVESLSDADGAATLSAFTVESTAAALRHVPQAPARWLVGGGGRRNRNLMRRLSERLQVSVEPVEAIGFDGDSIEAQCFAYLGLRSRRGLPLSLPTTTGVPKPMTGGVFWPKPKTKRAPLARGPGGKRDNATL